MNIFLDGAVIEHFKAKAGARGYQTLINETLKQAIQAETLEGVIRKTIREELRRARRRVGAHHREPPRLVRGVS